MKYLLFLAAIVSAMCLVNCTLAGGWEKQEDNFPGAVDMAKWTLSQLSEYTGLAGEHKLVEVTEVFTQVVSGMKYKFTATVRVGSNAQSCKITVYDQSWTGTREIIGQPSCSAA